MSKKNKKVFNISRHQTSYQAIADVLNRGGVVACASDLGCVLLGRFDLVQVRERLRLWPGGDKAVRLFLCVGNSNKFISLCEGSASAGLSDFLKVLCLNWGVIWGIFRCDLAKKFAWSERKMGFLCTQEATIKAVLDASSSSSPLVGTIIKGEAGKYGPGSNSEEALCALGKGADLFIVSDNGWRSIEPLLIDFSSNDWRVLQLGLYTYEELSALTSKRLILSSDRLKNANYRRIAAASVWIYRGEDSKIISRFMYMLENYPSFSKSSVFFLQSENVYKCIKSFIQNEEAVFPLFPSEVLHSGELIKKFDEVRLRENVRTIIIELAAEGSVNLEKFIDYIDYLADRRVDLFSRRFGEDEFFRGEVKTVSGGEDA